MESSNNTPCSFIWWLDDIFQPKRSGIICYERQAIIQHQLPNLAPWENSHLKLSSRTVLVTYWVSLLFSEAPLEDVLHMSSFQTD